MSQHIHSSSKCLVIASRSMGVNRITRSKRYTAHFMLEFAGSVCGVFLGPRAYLRYGQGCVIAGAVRAIPSKKQVIEPLHVLKDMLATSSGTSMVGNIHLIEEFRVSHFHVGNEDGFHLITEVHTQLGQVRRDISTRTRTNN